MLRGVPRAGEFGSIPELITLFVRTTRGYLIPPDSLVVIASASQLMAGGLAAYARDLCEAADQFEGIFNGEVDLVPGPVDPPSSWAARFTGADQDSVGAGKVGTKPAGCCWITQSHL